MKISTLIHIRSLLENDVYKTKSVFDDAKAEYAAGLTYLDDDDPKLYTLKTDRKTAYDEWMRAKDALEDFDSTDWR